MSGEHHHHGLSLKHKLIIGFYVVLAIVIVIVVDSAFLAEAFESLIRILIDIGIFAVLILIGYFALLRPFLHRHRHKTDVR